MAKYSTGNENPKPLVQYFGRCNLDSYQLLKSLLKDFRGTLLRLMSEESKSFA